MKIGVVGTSVICEDLVNAMKKVSGLEVVCSYSRNIDKAKEFCVKLGIDNPFDDFDKMINSDLINFVYIASPNSLHYSQCKKALLAGKNVILEKPFSSNAMLANKLVELAKSKKLYLFEAITNIHNPLLREIKSHLATIAPIRLVQANMSQYSRKYDLFLQGQKPNVFSLDFSGGALMDLNVYNIHFITELFNKPNSVTYSAMLQDGIDTAGALTLNYDGFICSLLSAKNTPCNSFVQIQGENGYIYVDKASSYIGSYSVNCRLDSTNNVVSKQVESYDNYQNEIKCYYDIYKANDYNKCCELLDHTLMVMDIIDQAKASANLVFKEDRECIDN